MKIERSVEARRELAGDLEEMLLSDGWRYVAQVALTERMAEISRKLGLGRKLDLETVRELQARYEMLAEMVQRPRDFFRLAKEKP